MKIDLLRKMIRIRCFEEEVSRQKLVGNISGPVHTCIGQEAVSVGVCSALSKDDYIISTHRSHGHLIAKGTDLKYLMDQVLKGNSMHVSDISVGAICSTAIVGSGLPLACGMAFATKYKNDDKVTCVFFGDGAFSEGVFHECMNLASMWRLPILFVLENNRVAVTTITKNNNLYKYANSYGISSSQVDGQRVDKVFDSASDAIMLILSTGMPYLLECMTYRFGEHQEGKVYEKIKDSGYRNTIDVDYFRENLDPINLYSAKLIDDGVLSQEDIDDIIMEEKQ